jgi:hypothetical protein
MGPRKIDFQTVDIDAVQPHPKNVRHGDIGAISQSLEAHGQYRPIVVDRRSNRILAGNHTWKSAKALGWKTISVGYIETKNDHEALRILLADNKANDLANYDEPALVDLLKDLAETDEGLEGSLYDGDDLDQLIADQGFFDDTSTMYVQDMKIPQYEIVGEQPQIAELYDDNKAKEFQATINKSDISDDIKQFLTIATMRHIVFDYQKIAEFYPHQTPEIQKLIEQSALVIIDVDDAIANGYAQFNATITDIRELDDDA